jgi:hypothetical protein
MTLINAAQANAIFAQSITDYHTTDSVDAPILVPYAAQSVEYLLYRKNWIDTVQWHLEDIIRSPTISPVELVAVKRRIDASNQDRTDMVEQLDDYFMAAFANINPPLDARINSETPAWLLDRMSILLLKVYHMREQTERTDVAAVHRDVCAQKLAVLLEQKTDMAQCFDELMHDLRTGARRMKVYRQMKMYNDASLNPVLYQQK